MVQNAPSRTWIAHDFIKAGTMRNEGFGSMRAEKSIANLLCSMTMDPVQGREVAAPRKYYHWYDGLPIFGAERMSVLLSA